MKLIAHRALTKGPDPLLENHPDQIQKTLGEGFDCEVDVWQVENKLYLGHDNPTYLTTESFLANSRLWIHAKNLDALHYLSSHADQYHFFWHEKDAFARTSRGFLWTYPGQPLTAISVCVMPELIMPIEATAQIACYAICSDYVHQIKAETC